MVGVPFYQHNAVFGGESLAKVVGGDDASNAATEDDYCS